MTRILFLEDEDTIREVLTEYMKIAGYEVDEASSGTAAQELLGRHSYDIAVLDIMVPGKSGLEILEYIKTTPGLSHMGIIMLTALDDTNTQVNAFNSLADDYVIKPVSAIILLKRIEALLRRVSSGGSSAVEKGLSINAESYSVSWNSEKIPLTISEFLLLQMLYENKNRVFTREQLIMGIFNEDYAGNDRIIDAHVKNIRKKLPVNCIKTIIGIGYQFGMED